MAKVTQNGTKLPKVHKRTNNITHSQIKTVEPIMETAHELELIPTEDAHLKRYNMYESKKNLFLANLIQTGGNISKACTLTNIGRQTYYMWCIDHPELNTSVMETMRQIVNETRYNAIATLNDKTQRQTLITKKQALTRDGQVVDLIEEREVQGDSILTMFALNNTGQELGYNTTKQLQDNNLPQMKLPDFIGE